MAEFKEQSPLEQFRTALLARGQDSIKSFSRQFRIMDDDGNMQLNLEELKKGVHDFGLEMCEDKVRQMFDCFDKDCSGSISFDEFVQALRSMSKRRQEIVQEAFNKVDKNDNGVIDPGDLEGQYNATGHPMFVKGEWDERRVFEEFLKSFEPYESQRDGKVTPEEFMNYYAGVSASIDNDEYFELMIKNAWQI